MNRLKIMILMIVIFFVGCFEENKEIDEFPMEIYNNKVIKSVEGKWILFTNGTNVNVEEIIFVNYYRKLKSNIVEIALKHKKSLYIYVNNYNICKEVTEKINKVMREYKK